MREELHERFDDPTSRRTVLRRLAAGVLAGLAAGTAFAGTSSADASDGLQTDASADDVASGGVRFADGTGDGADATGIDDDHPDLDSTPGGGSDHADPPARDGADPASDDHPDLDSVPPGRGSAPVSDDHPDLDSVPPGASERSE